jgi:hypothetical protein
MRVKFIRDRNWTPPERRMITVAYKAGMELTVKRAWGAQMVADGDAVRVPAPRRSDEPGSSSGRKSAASAPGLGGDDEGSRLRSGS